MTTYLADYAWLGDRLARDVHLEVHDGRFTAINADKAGMPGRPAAGGGASAGAADAGPGGGAAGPDAAGPDAAGPDAAGVERLPGLVLPGFANAHSHAFHRALRGRTHHGGPGSFWTWRDLMYETAATLDPDGYLRLARAVFAEMALSGITAVGEFHYLHHSPDGTPYADPNAMGHALIEAAQQAGLRITLLDTLYLQSGVDGQPPDGVQRRFSDRTPQRWAERVAGLAAAPHARIGAAIHSVRAVAAHHLEELGGFRPLHLHLSEQPAENEQCRAAHGCTPTELLDRHGILGPDTTAVHATHLTDNDVKRLGDSRTTICMCPTTERDLADGIGRARDLADAGSPVSLGSDSHAVIDMLAEARALEMNERLATRQRGRFTPADLITAATAHASIGWPDAGAIAVGNRADLVCLSLDSVRTAGADPAAAILAATASDVTHVIVDGRPIVVDGRHTTIDVPRALAEVLR
ncbi:formimidoylglutamate deiminase [Paractinoplanes ferrugineus]|uniref:Formimidoylglutamate deiminase n=1 Tax=Paractinoplanes ferrugineus TaxID=113564 RepID=A0A919IXA2_9ACTN|nr:formimidoylglutamate deiminase [Actinoplanes ferrugineus]GIE09642.1 formimidoylglutamate deiminase [Actinoplanes ferrugineus]